MPRPAIAKQPHPPNRDNYSQTKAGKQKYHRHFNKWYYWNVTKPAIIEELKRNGRRSIAQIQADVADEVPEYERPIVNASQVQREAGIERLLEKIFAGDMEVTW